MHNGDNSAFAETGQFLFAHRYLLSPGVDAQRFTAEGLREAIDETTSLLGTPAGSLVKPILLRDPTGETLSMAGITHHRVYDVGVAGIHRLFSRLDVIQSADVVIAVAGMEGAHPACSAGWCETRSSPCPPASATARTWPV